MKRIFFLILVLTLVLSCFTFEGSVMADSEIYGDEAIAHFKNLGLISQNTDGDAMMSRGEFAQLIYNISGKNNVPDNSYRFFDVAEDNEYYSAVLYMAQNGFMQGSDGYFRPYDSITYIQGMTVMARVLRYTEYAKANGDYTLGYYKTASELGILKNTGVSSTDEPMRVRNVSAMVYNAMRTEMNKLAEINPFYYTFIGSGKIYAYESMGLNYAKGVMTSNGYADVSGKENKGKYLIVVDNKGYNVRNMKDTEYLNYLGQEVSLWYDDDYNVASIVPTGKSNVVSFTGDELLSKSSDKIKFIDKNNNEYSLRINSKTMWMKNGEVALDYKDTGFEISDYSNITLIDGDGDGIFDYALVNNYKTFVVSTIDSEGFITGVGGKDTLNLSEDTGKTIFVYNTNGELKSYEDIKADYVVSAIEGKDFIYVIYANTVTTGLLTEKDTYSFVINGMLFELGSNTKLLNNIKLGDNIAVYTDFADRLVYVTKKSNVSSNTPHGYLIDALHTSGIEDSLKLEIFTNDETISVFECAEKFSIYNGADTVYYNVSALSSIPAELLNGGAVKNEIILYTLNADNKISSITVSKASVGDDEDGFLKPYENQKGYIISNGTVTTSNDEAFSGRAFIDKNTEIFVVPNDLKNDDGYGIISKSYLQLNTNMNWDIYYYSKNNMYCDIAVIHGDYAQGSYDTVMSVVLSVGEGLDSKGNKAVLITHFSKDAVVKTTAAYDVSITRLDGASIKPRDLKPGDAVRFSINKSGSLRSGQLVYDYDDSKFVGVQNSSVTLTTSLYVTNGYIASNSSTLMRLAATKDQAFVKNSDILTYPGFIYSSAKIMVVEDSRRGVEVRKGSASDLILGDYVVYQARAGVGAYLILYKDK